MSNAGRVVFITGAAKGIGLACASWFAQQGDRVVVADIDLAAAQTAVSELPGGGHLVYALDVADASAIQSAISATVEHFGRLDVLINNAGIGDEGRATVEQSLDYFDKVIDIHLRGSYLCSKFAAAHMLKHGGGVIVNLSSIAALGGLPTRNAYSAAKAGLSAMTRAMACEWGGQGIRVNAVAPGYVRTELVAQLTEKGVLDTNKIHRRTPLGRMAEPAEIATAIGFLASPAASFITGVTLSVDGGWMANAAAT